MSGGIRRGKLKLKNHSKISKPTNIFKKKPSTLSNSKEEPETIWRRALLVSHIKGPIIILSKESIICCAKAEKKPSLLANANLEDQIFIPTSTEQVWFSSSIIEGRITIKNGSTGKLLSSDKEGQISVTKEAIGPGDEWIPYEHSQQIDTIKVSYFALQNYTFKNWLYIDEFNNLKAVSDKENSLFTIQYQKRHKDMITNISNSSHQSRESSLEERIKKKHDPYC